MAKVAGILGKKVGMTQLFDSKGEVRPATVLQAGPCVITQHKTALRDGYESAQIGLVEFVKEKRLTKPMQGHFAKNSLPPMKFLREVPIEVEEQASEGAEANGLKVGHALNRVNDPNRNRRQKASQSSEESDERSHRQAKPFLDVMKFQNVEKFQHPRPVLPCR